MPAPTLPGLCQAPQTPARGCCPHPRLERAWHPGSPHVGEMPRYAGLAGAFHPCCPTLPRACSIAGVHRRGTCMSMREAGGAEEDPRTGWQGWHVVLASLNSSPSTGSRVGEAKGPPAPCWAERVAWGGGGGAAELTPSCPRRSLGAGGPRRDPAGLPPPRAADPQAADEVLGAGHLRVAAPR